MKTATQIQDGLSQFYGTQAYHRLSIFSKRLVATDGVAWLCQNAECFWLFDAIASHQPRAMKDPKGMLQDMQFWTLKKDGKGGCLLKCERDTDDVFITQEIPFTDFPLDEVKIWIERGELADGPYMVAMLPSER